MNSKYVPMTAEDWEEMTALYVRSDNAITGKTTWHEYVQKSVLARIEAQGLVIVPRETLDSWRLSLSQGDASPRWEIEAMLEATKEST